MSTPLPHDTIPEEGKKRLSKYVSKAKTLIRSGSKRLSISRSSKIGVVTAPPAESRLAEPTESPQHTRDPVAPKPIATPLPPQPKSLLRSDIEAERVRRLAARYKIQIQPLDWGFAHDQEAFRIEKPVRMRIHRTCHRCGSTYGSTKFCTKCDHVRCTKCPRYPSKEKGKARERPADYLEPDPNFMSEKELPLTRPSRTGGQPLVRKKPTQRVRRTCHECATIFTPGNKSCSTCSHLRCTDCPRDPAKKKRYPYGYPGDRPSAACPYFACHHCTKVYPPIREGNEQPECLRCKHVFCERCQHATPRKVEPVHDSDLLKSVEARIAAMKLASSATAA